jgi:hypothetical protein
MFSSREHKGRRVRFSSVEFLVAFCLFRAPGLFFGAALYGGGHLFYFIWGQKIINILYNIKMNFDLPSPDINVDEYDNKSIAELVATTKSINEQNKNPNSLKKIHSDPAVFVSLRAHSSIPYNFTSKLFNTFRKPKGIHLVKLTAAENGGMNSSENISYKDKNDIIFDVIKEDKPSIIVSAERIQKLIRFKEKENNVANFDQRNVVTEVIGGSKNNGKMLNKQITPYSENEIQERELENYMPIKLSFLNKTEENPLGEVISADIFDLVNQNIHADERPYTTIQKIIEYLQSIGIKRIVLLDFTCSTITENYLNDTENSSKLNPEELQNIIKHLNENDYHGGKKQLLRPRKSSRRHRRQGRRTKKAIRKRT